MSRGRAPAARNRAYAAGRAKTKAEKIDAGQQGRVLAMVATGQPFEEVLVELVRTVEAHGTGMLGSVLLVDPDGRHLRIGAAPGLPDEYNRAVDGVPIGPASGSCGTAAHLGRRVVAENIATDPFWTEYRDVALAHGIKACWSQPIFSTDRRVIGTFAMYYRRPKGPSRSDVERIEAAAHLAGIAIERHLADERQRALEQRLRRQGAALAELAKSDELAREDFKAFARLATEKAATTLGVERVSVWLFSADRSVLQCEDLFEASRNRHSQGAELQSTRYPNYFAALVRGRVLAARDARSDPATCEFSESYLTPLGIGSMLDASLRRAGRLIGVVCHEHLGPPRDWAPEEQEFAASIAEFVSLALETTERRRAEEAVRTAQNELLVRQQQEKQLVDAELEKVKADLVRQTRLATIGQVALSIAHELRNPLGALRNAAYYLGRRAPADDPKWAEYLEIIEHEIHQADRIVSDLTEMSRAKEPSKRTVDLAQAVHETLAYLPDREGIQVQLELDPDPFQVLADADQLRQVLVNLFTNSAQALDGRGQITVRAWREGGFDFVTVVDDGPGIPAHLQKQIFEPLFTTKAKGTGLGLAICRQIVEQHGGTVELAGSIRGAVFRIRLPRSSVGS